MATCKCGSDDIAWDGPLCWECYAQEEARKDAETLAKLRAKVTEAKPYGVLGCQFGRAWDSWIDTFATLEEAKEFIKSHWQGEDFIDSDTSFHTDYSTWELIGFTLTDVGLDRASLIKADTLPNKTCSDDCDLGHCSMCGSHMAGGYLPPSTICSACEHEERLYREEAELERRMEDREDQSYHDSYY